MKLKLFIEGNLPGLIGILVALLFGKMAGSILAGQLDAGGTDILDRICGWILTIIFGTVIISLLTLFGRPTRITRRQVNPWRLRLFYIAYFLMGIVNLITWALATPQVRNLIPFLGS